MYGITNYPNNVNNTNNHSNVGCGCGCGGMECVMVTLPFGSSEIIPVTISGNEGKFTYGAKSYTITITNRDPLAISTAVLSAIRGSGSGSGCANNNVETSPKAPIRPR